MKTLIWALSFWVTVFTANAQANLEAMQDYTGTSPSGGNPIYSSIYASINGPIGWTFQPNTDIDVTALGAFDYLIPAFDSLDVGLWDSNGTLLASQAVSAASLAAGHSRYETIAPLPLLASKTYYLAAYSASGPLSAVVVTPDAAPNGYATMSPEIQLGLAAYSSGSGFSFPGTTDGNPGYAIIAPNFEFHPTPEPSALLLSGGGLITLLLLNQRRHA